MKFLILWYKLFISLVICCSGTITVIVIGYFSFRISPLLGGLYLLLCFSFFLAALKDN